MFIKILFFIILSVNFVHAGGQPAIGAVGFGSSCVALPNMQYTDYLVKNSIYGYVQSFLNMEVNTQGITDNTKCTDGLAQIDLCIYNNLKNPTCDFVTFKANDSKTIGSISKNSTLVNDSNISSIVLTASMANSTTLCIYMQTSYGTQPLLCKNIPVQPVPPPLQPCSVTEACVGINPSQSMLNFSGSAIECVTAVLDTVFFNPAQCSGKGAAQTYTSNISNFAVFQQSMQSAVGALLILYVMFYGFEVILNQDKFSLESVAMKIFKFIMVAYFSVGLGPFYFQYGYKTIHNGMIDWGLPILREATNDFAQMVFAAGSTSGLCSFDPATYPPGKGAYALWDTIDCKIGAYLGDRGVYNLGSILTDERYIEVAGQKIVPPTAVISVLNGPDQLDPTNTSVGMGLVSVLSLLMLGGNPLTAICILIYLVIYISMIASFISVYVVCFITLHILVYISPIFIPLALFERTSQYYQSWLKATVGCAIQPMVIAGFLAIVMNIYDDILFGQHGCEFVTHFYNFRDALGMIDSTQLYKTFEMYLPSNSTDCTSTIGYKFLAYGLGHGSSSINLLIVTFTQINDTLNAFGDSLLLLILAYLFYQVWDMMYSFGADISGGLNVKDVSVNAAAKVVNGVINAGKLAVRIGMAVATKGKSEADKMKNDVKNKVSGNGGDSSPKRASVK